MNSEIFNAIRTTIVGSREQIETVKNRINQATTNILEKKQMVYIPNTQEDIYRECDYMFKLLDKAIMTSIDNNIENTSIPIDKNSINYLKTNSIEKCPGYNQYNNTMLEMGIKLDVYKSFKGINSIEFDILRKRLEVYH